MEDVEIGFLIGFNCFSVVRLRDIIYGEQNDLYVVRLFLGWYINGSIERKGNGAVYCNRIQIYKISVVEDVSGYIVVERSVKEQITFRVVERMFELDFFEKENGTVMFREDREFLRKVEEGIYYCEDLYYEMLFSFREENIQFLDNRF